MPTGYTAGIVYGKTKDFKEFAKQCIRNFGATIHMRDEPMDKEWEPRKPSDYHIKEIEKAKAELEAAQTLTLEQITEERRLQLEKGKEYYTNKIKETEEIEARLKNFLSEAHKFVPPTQDHVGVREFMIQQITETLKYDGSTKYQREHLERIEAELKDLQPEVIKAEKIESSARNLKYHTDEHQKELKRCADSNLWVEQFLSAL